LAGNWDGMNLDDLWALMEKNLDRLPFMEQFKNKILDEQQKIGKVNILIAGKTGVGTSTIVNAVFGEDVAPTGAGRPVTDEIRWYEPASLPVRLCDTKGLELANFEEILADLEAEIERSTKSGKIEDRVHVPGQSGEGST
jgi:predicted GTPase